MVGTRNTVPVLARLRSKNPFQSGFCETNSQCDIKLQSVYKVGNSMNK